MITRRTFIKGLGITAAVLPIAAAPKFLPGTGPDWGQLSARLQGSLVLPGDPSYAVAKQLDLEEFDAISPQAVAYCASAADVSACLLFARGNGLPLAARSGGHSAAGYSTTTGLVIDVSQLNAVTVGTRTATLGAGVQLVDAVNTLAPYGQTVSGGFCPTVALGGFLQGGGIGLLTRGVGISCDTVQSAEVVLASGELVTASAQQHPDLYWAIRGGGGNFGVVTSYTVAPTAVTQLDLTSLSWSFDDAATVLDGWSRWLVDAPNAIGSSAVLTLADAAPGNEPAVSVLVGSPGDATVLATEVQRLIAVVGVAPTGQVTLSDSYQSIMMSIYGCGSYTVPACHRQGSSPAGLLPRTAFAVERSRLFSAPPPLAMWEAAVSIFADNRVAGQTHMIQLGALGGAANDLPRTATAYVHRDALISVSFLGIIATATGTPAAISAAEGAAQHWADTGFSLIDPYSNGETYQNFIDPELRDWRWSYYAENYPRLVEVKQAYDPDDLFSFPQSIG
jgi:FAD/FMN-containing dehydrogenase